MSDVTLAMYTLKSPRSVLTPRSADLALPVFHRARPPPLTMPPIPMLTMHRRPTRRSPQKLPPLLNRPQLMPLLLPLTPRSCMAGRTFNNLALRISSPMLHGCVYTRSLFLFFLTNFICLESITGSWTNIQILTYPLSRMWNSSQPRIVRVMFIGSRVF